MALLAIGVAVVRGVASGHSGGGIGDLGAVGFASCALLLVVRQLRAVVAVWIDPVENSMTLFRAVGSAIRTHPSRVRRIDHGWLDTHYRSPNADFFPTRIVTDHGTAAIARHNPHIHVEL